MKTFLLILFMIDGQPKLVEGFYPYDFKTEEICERGKDHSMIYLNSIPNLPQFTMECVTEGIANDFIEKAS